MLCKPSILAASDELTAAGVPVYQHVE